MAVSTAPETQVDERTLPAAVDQLYRAVAVLVDDPKEYLNGQLRAGVSWWRRLTESVSATSRREGAKLVPSSRPNVWTPAVDQVKAVESEVREWLPGPDDVPTKLRALAARRWTPGDTETVTRIAERITGMTIDIKNLLEPARVKTFAAPCPGCGQRWSYRMVDGERLRQPALHLVAEQGCTCLSCRRHWPPDQFVFLAKLLGCDPVGATG